MCVNESVVLPLPDDIDTTKQVRSISADKCIADILPILWNKKWQTRGCCCGHGKSNPSIIINETHSDDEILELKKLISSIDIRCWDILQWRLNKV